MSGDNDEEGGESKRAKMMKSAGQYGFGCQLILTTAAVCCGFVAMGACAFADRSVQLVPGSTISDLCADFAVNECNAYAENHAVSYWAWQGTGSNNEKICLSYTQPVPGVGYVTLPVDSKFNTGKAGLILGLCFGLLAFFTLLIASCCPLDPTKMAGLSCYYVLATLFQGLSFMIYPSNACQKGFFDPFYTGTTLSDSIESASCSLGMGAKASVAATVLYFVGIFTAPFSAPPPPIGGHPQGGGEPGDDEPGDAEPGDAEPGDKEPGDDEPGDKEPGDGDNA